MTRNHLFACLAVVLLPACGPEATTDAGVDAGRIDTSPPTGPGLPAVREAAAGSTAEFCRCLPLRNPMLTEAGCLDANLPDVDLSACEDRATAAIGTAFDAYYHCRAAAFRTLQGCYAVTCSTAAVRGCIGDFQRVNTTCNAMLPSMTVVQTYLAEYQACIVERVTGNMQNCPDDPSVSSSAVGAGVFSGTTELAGNDSEPFMSCLPDAMSLMDAMGSPDRSYRWLAPASGRYRIDTVGSDFDTLLYLRSACTDTVDVACNDDIVLGTDQDSCVVVDAAAGQEFVVIVDGFGDRVRGNFVVNITRDAACADADAGVPDADAGVVDVDAGVPDADAGVADADVPDAP